MNRALPKGLNGEGPISLNTRLREGLSILSVPGSDRWIVRPLSTRERGEAVFSMELVAERNEAAPFRAGQSVALSFPGEGILSRARLAPIASGPGRRDRLEFCFRDSDDWTLTLRERLESIALNGSLPIKARISRPSGSFFLDNGSSVLRHVFIAEGMGAVPFFSMISDLVQKDRTRGRLLFIWGAQTRNEFFGLDRLESDILRMEDARFIPILSHDPLWKGEKGEIDAGLLDKLVPEGFGMGKEVFEWALPSWFISGSREFVRTTRRILRERGALSAAIRSTSGRA